MAKSPEMRHHTIIEHFSLAQQIAHLNRVTGMRVMKCEGRSRKKIYPLVFETPEGDRKKVKIPVPGLRLGKRIGSITFLGDLDYERPHYYELVPKK